MLNFHYHFFFLGKYCCFQYCWVDKSIQFSNGDVYSGKVLLLILNRVNVNATTPVSILCSHGNTIGIITATFIISYTFFWGNIVASSIAGLISQFNSLMVMYIQAKFYY